MSLSGQFFQVLFTVHSFFGSWADMVLGPGLEGMQRLHLILLMTLPQGNVS